MDKALEIDAQYRAVREGAGLLDRSDRARIAVRGTEAPDFLQGQLTNDIEALEPGEGCYSALLDRKGKIRADMRVICVGAGEFLIDTEEETGELVLDHLGMYKIGRDAEVERDPRERAILSLIGPLTSKLLGDLPLGPEHSNRDVFIAGVACRAITTDLGADLLVPAENVDVITAALTSSGAGEINQTTAEIVRVESGRPRVGREIGATTMPQEAGINDRAVSFTKGCYIGQETVARLHYKGKPNRHLRLLRPEQPVTAGDPVSSGGREVGNVGTAVISPARGPLALAILRREAEPGTSVVVGDHIAAVVESLEA